MWDPLIGFLQGILVACGGLGILIGIAAKAVAGPDEGRHAFSHKIMASSATGLMIGLMAEDISGLMFSWM